jgi:holo-[acyl-carrier protein] synthase
VVVGLGIDLVEEERVARSLARWGDRLVGKLMGPEEAARLPVGEARPAALARAIAAKEAASKAIGTGWSRGVAWRDVVVDLGPPPAVRLERRAAQVARHLGSAGRTETTLEARDGLVIGRVILLA